jgi:hypothetical protein
VEFSADLVAPPPAVEPHLTLAEESQLSSTRRGA